MGPEKGFQIDKDHSKINLMNKYLSYKNYVYKLKVANKKLKSLLNFCSNGFEIIGDYFPSALIHVNSIENQRKWLFINRGYDNEIYIKDLNSKMELVQ